MNGRIVARLAGAGCLALTLAACPPDDQRTETLDPTTAGRQLTGV